MERLTFPGREQWNYEGFKRSPLCPEVCCCLGVGALGIWLVISVQLQSGLPNSNMLHCNFSHSNQRSPKFRKRNAMFCALNGSVRLQMKWVWVWVWIKRAALWSPVQTPLGRSCVKENLHWRDNESWNKRLWISNSKPPWLTVKSRFKRDGELPDFFFAPKYSFS